MRKRSLKRLPLPSPVAFVVLFCACHVERSRAVEDTHAHVRARCAAAAPPPASSIHVALLIAAAVAAALARRRCRPCVLRRTPCLPHALPHRNRCLSPTGAPSAERVERAERSSSTSTAPDSSPGPPTLDERTKGPDGQSSPTNLTNPRSACGGPTAVLPVGSHITGHFHALTPPYLHNRLKDALPTSPSCL